MMKWAVLGATGVLAAMWAGLLPPQWGVWAGMFYPTLSGTMPYLAIRYEKKAEQLVGS
jgi:hypothetical protein